MMTTLFDLLRNTIKGTNDTEETFAIWYNDNDRGDDEEFAFGSLWEEAGIIAYYLRVGWNLNKGDRVVLCYSFGGVQFLTSFLGCIRAGVIAVLVPPPSRPFTKSLPKMTNVVNNCNAKLIIIDSIVQTMRYADRANNNSKSRQFWPNSALFKAHDFQGQIGENEGSVLSFYDSSILPTDLAFLQYTSQNTEYMYTKEDMVTFDTLESNARSIIWPVLIV